MNRLAMLMRSITGGIRSLPASTLPVGAVPVVVVVVVLVDVDVDVLVPAPPPVPVPPVPPVAPVPPVPPVSPVPEPVPLGGAVIVQVREAGVGSTLPAVSIARTSKVWVATLRLLSARGDWQPAHCPESIRHSNVAPASEAKPKLADVASGGAGRPGCERRLRGDGVDPERA